MSQLAAPRIGWENEHLAAYLLSRIAFIAHPAKHGDDIGSDFFCTIFKRIVKGRSEQLLPLNSFAIQVKSNRNKVSFSNKENYLYNLELPFFLGVVDRPSLSLEIFSGENIPMMFSMTGHLDRLDLELITSEVPYGDAWEFDRNLKSCVLRLPRIATIAADDGMDDIVSHGKLLWALCSRVHDNISAKKNNEYIFKLKGKSDFAVFAGSGSVETFRDNLCLRLTEAFFNLKWILDNPYGEFNMEEYEAYKNLYLYIMNNESEKISPEIIKMLNRIYEELSSEL